MSGNRTATPLQVNRYMLGNRTVTPLQVNMYMLAGIHLERGFASMPRRSVKRHIIFCHACPSPAFFSTVCAIVI